MEAQLPPGFDNFSHFNLRRGVDMRPTLLRVLTDLYVQKLTHTPDEERHYTELALRLLEAVDVPARVAVARRLSALLSPPLQVIRFLAADLPDVAASVLAHPVLQAPAHGDETASGPVGAPADQAPRPHPDSRAGDPPRALDPATADELNELFFTADAHERRLILLNLDVVAPLSTGPGITVDPSAGERLEAAALARDREGFARQLARSLQIPREQARRVVRDNFGEPSVVSGKALGIPREAIHRILLFLNPIVGQSVERVHALAALHDEMTAQAAEGMVTIWQCLRTTERSKPAHRPLTWDDEMSSRARPAAAAQRTSAATTGIGKRGAS